LTSVANIGLLIGGRVEHECSTQRGIGYFLEALICLAPFCKHPLEATLKGVTNDGSGQDPSPEMIKTSTLPVLKRFILNDEGLELKIVHRGASPAGGGQV
jgi:RNA 3'-terminal phosphate cyclase-like protein